jgi:hypothetical protein
MGKTITGAYIAPQTPNVFAVGERRSTELHTILPKRVLKLGDPHLTDIVLVFLFSWSQQGEKRRG